MEFVIRNARLKAGAPTVDIGIEKGRIAAIERSLPVHLPGYDAKGCLACAGLVETHIHVMTHIDVLTEF